MSPLTRVPIKSYRGGRSSREIDFESISPGDEYLLRGLELIRLYLSWPGYSTSTTQPAIHCARMTKADLKVAVMQEIEKFMKKCSSVPIANSHAQWRIGPGAITKERLVLKSVLDMGHDVWQAQLFVEL